MISAQARQDYWCNAMFTTVTGTLLNPARIFGIELLAMKRPISVITAIECDAHRRLLRSWHIEGAQSRGARTSGRSTVLRELECA